MKRLATVVLSLAVAFCAGAQQQDPDVERGFRPGLAYQTNDLDTVNLFNGTITINIPIGPTFPVGGTLSYGFQASYGTNHWDTHMNTVDLPDGTIVRFPYKYPTPHSNAGFGWVVTLGALVSGENGTAGGYLAPDGGIHKFYSTLHANDSNEVDVSGVSYTRDGTYLRMTTVGANRVIDFPNGHRHTFDSSGRLREMADPFGNSVTLAYTTQNTPGDPFAGSTLLTITDSVGRTHKVYFRPNWSYESIKENETDPDPIGREMVALIRLAAYGGTTADYQFVYLASPTAQEPITFAYKTSRRCEARSDPNMAQYVVTSLLTRIELPEGIDYEMDYERGDRETCSWNAPLRPLGASGNITRLVLPTGNGQSLGGRIEWNYQKYVFPGEGTQSVNAGILDKKVFDGANLIAHTAYEIDKIPRTDLTTAPTSQQYDFWRRVMQKDGAGTLLSSSRHYFTGCRKTYAEGTCNAREYGLPLTRTQSRAGGGYLSYEVEIPNSSARRKRWVEYEGDGLLGPQLLPFSSLNQRVSFEAIEYENGKTATTVHSQFDGLGHYRRTVTGGDFASANAQTSHTNYNPAAGTYALSSTGSLQSGFSLPSAWLLTTFDKQWTSNDTTTAASTYCFDSAGFLTSRRTFKNFGQTPVATTQDLLAIFTRDSAGQLTDERYYGGDQGSVAPTGFICNTAAPGGEAYRLKHGYQYGRRNMSRYVNGSGSDLSFDLLDADIDLNTGLTAASRSFSTASLSDGVVTTYEYDLLGRPKDTYVKQPASTTRLHTKYEYVPISPRVTVTDLLPDGTKIRESTAYFDVLGRLTTETRSMPSGATSTRTTKYNALGWTTESTDWGATAPTVYSHDAFGRPISVRTPDLSDQTAPQFAYDGVSTVTKTTKVHTGFGTFTDAVTTEEYDRLGRLWRITEPAATVGGSRPVTQYEYDVAGRLVKVCANKNLSTGLCGQVREFQYDNRGFLTSETHPENGTTAYPAYDARGHLLRRYVGTEFGPQDLKYEYDRAERLTHVYRNFADPTPPRILKHFSYSTSNTTTELRNGRLYAAMRFNWLDFGSTTYNARVVETYKYEDPLGGVSWRETLVDSCVVSSTEQCNAVSWSGTADRRFEQTFTYDVLGNVATLGYPQCIDCPNAMGARTITNQYDNGLLSSVTWNGAAVPNTFTYHPSGLIKEVNHDNGVKDVTGVDEKVPSRPSSIATENVLSSGCVVPSFSVQPASVTRAAGQVQLTAHAAGESGQAVNYQWYEGVAPNTAVPVAGQTTATLTKTLSATTNFWVAAWNTCSGASRTPSVTATVTICSPPAVTAPADQTLTRTRSMTLIATATGSPGLKYQWYRILNNTPQIIDGATDADLTVGPEVTTRYRVIATNACDQTASDDVIVTVVDQPTTPTSLSAAYNTGTLKNELTWASSTSAVGVDHYEVERQDGVVFVVGNTHALVDAFVSPGATYVYRVRAFDSQGVSSDLSAADFASVFTFTAPEPIPAPSSSLTLIRGVYISELRQAVDSVRTAAGLTPAWSSYSPPAGLITAEIFTQLRDRLNDARSVLLLPAVTFSDPVGAGHLIRRSCVNDLRAGVK